MRNLILTILLLSVFTLAGGTVFAQQCDTEKLTPIKCGYYLEGYEDGASDARNDLRNDYKRYRSKFENKYQSFFRSGYDEGYASVKPFARWTDRQKNTYDQGFDDGKDDRKKNISRLPARYEGQYDKDAEQYFNRGYLDGYDGRQKNYDVPVTNPPNQLPRVDPRFPRGNSGNTGNRRTRKRGTRTGTASWNGRVDNRVNIIIKGDTIRTQRVAGDLTNTFQNLQGVLPRTNAMISVRTLDGRGNVRVLQQPNRTNDFTAIVEVSDPKRGRDNYNLQISWTASSIEEPYAAGKLTWKGRVDSEVLVRVSGEMVEATDVNGTGLSGVDFDLTGYLAGRPGTVRLRQRDGRGTIEILEQPSRNNDYTALIRIFDAGGGDDEYEFELEW